MINRFLVIGIVIGVFIAGIAIGYLISYSSLGRMMQNYPSGQMMWNEPTLPNSWMNNMMANPNLMRNWENSMMNNPQFMNKWMTELMSNSDFRQQYMGPWYMTQNNQLRNQMMSIIPEQNATFYAHPIIKTNSVSIESGAWQYNKTESYSPTIIQIITGTTVTWTNNDSVIHTVTDLKGSFDSDIIQPDSSWKHTFYNEGKYTYFCTIHPWMKGVVIVT